MNKEILDSVFRSYDIRGTTNELTEDFFYNLGKAFVTFNKAKTLAVGYDIRPESKVFALNFIKGLKELGCNVHNIGEVATEMLYFTVGNNPYLDGGAVITASHNPAGWNGCKMVGKEVKAYSSEYGLKEIKEIMLNESYDSVTNESGKEEHVDIYPDFKNKVLSILDDTKIKKTKIVVDAGNGIGGKVFDYVFGKLGFIVEKMYFEPDGTFPNHVPNPIEEENVKEIKKRVVDANAQLGIAIDGDSDRVFFIDSKGRNPSGVFTGSIFAKYYCQKNAGAKIIHDTRVIWPITKEIVKFGGVGIPNKAGHSFIKERMKNEDAVFGTELSSHFFYKDFFHADSGMVTIAMMIKILSEGLDLTSEMDYLYSNYFTTGEINYKIENKDEIIEKARLKYSDGQLDEIDGISIELDNWRFNIRKSNTEPYLRLNIEATSEQLLVDKFKELEELIGVPRSNLPSNPALQ